MFALPFSDLIGMCFAIIIGIVYSLFSLWAIKFFNTITKTSTKVK